MVLNYDSKPKNKLLGKPPTGKPQNYSGKSGRPTRKKEMEFADLEVIHEDHDEC